MSFVSTASALFSVTTQFLLRRLRRADKGWESAMAHKRYRDEPNEERPFTDEEHLRMWWAQSWRGEYHWIEGELYKQPDVRRGMCEGLTTREPLTIYEPT
jgi:hypothetical protein